MASGHQWLAPTNAALCVFSSMVIDFIHCMMYRLGIISCAIYFVQPNKTVATWFNFSCWSMNFSHWSIRVLLWIKSYIQYDQFQSSFKTDILHMLLVVCYIRYRSRMHNTCCRLVVHAICVINLLYMLSAHDACYNGCRLSILLFGIGWYQSFVHTPTLYNACSTR